MSTKTPTASSGVSFCSLLTILFVGLKLTNHIDWSWWWVLAPMWISIVVVLAICAIAIIGCGILMGAVKVIEIAMNMNWKRR